MRNILTELTGVFREVFDQESLELANSTTAADIEGWDSVMHISLIVAIEEHFTIRVSTAEVARLKNVGEMLGLIGEKLARKSR